MMILKRSAVSTFLVGIMGFGTSVVCGQGYPVKPVRIVTADVGAASDFAARLIAQALSVTLSQQVIVDNRSGAVPGTTVGKAQSDGYTLLLHGGSFWLAPYMQDVSYNVARDFFPITMVGQSFFTLVVHAAVPANSVKDLIALAKARPGELNYGSGTSGVPTHLSAELFKSMAGVNIVRIPYKGTGPALNGLLAGEVQLLFALPGTVTPHVKSGRLKALAVSSTRPTMLASGLPTISESGVPGYEVVSMLGMFAPARTPEPIVSRLNQEIVRALNGADVKEKFFSSGIEAVGSSPAQFDAMVKSEAAKWIKVIKDTGIRAE